MPIKGLMEFNDASLREGLPEIARAYKGDPKESNKPGRDLDYFRFEFNEQFADFKDIFVAMYSDDDGVFEPDAFERVHVAAETAEAAFDFWWEQWNVTQTLLHKCDGEHQVRWFDDRSKTYANGNKACAKLPDNTQPACECTRVGRLALILPEFTAQTGVFGYFLFQTHSINDIITIYQTLRMAENLARKAGKSLMSVPFTFGRVQQKISAPHQAKNKAGEYERTGKRMVVNKSLFYLHTEPEYTKAVLLPALVNAPALPEPKPQLSTGNENPENGKIVKLADTKLRATLGSGDEPRNMVVDPPAKTVYVSSKGRYLGAGTYSYLLFGGGDTPARLYLKDMDTVLEPLGKNWLEWSQALKPGPEDQVPFDLPESVQVTAVEDKTTTNGATVWKVVKIEAVAS